MISDCILCFMCCCLLDSLTNTALILLKQKLLSQRSTIHYTQTQFFCMTSNVNSDIHIHFPCKSLKSTNLHVINISSVEQ